MMIHEFTERTGYKPSCEEYREIERQYSESPLLKDEFCAQWRAHNMARRLIMQAVTYAAKRNYDDAELTAALQKYREIICAALF